MWCRHVILQARINFIRETQICTTVDEEHNKRTTGTTTDCWNRLQNKGSSHPNITVCQYRTALGKMWRNQRTATIGIKQMRNLWFLFCVCIVVCRGSQQEVGYEPCWFVWKEKVTHSIMDAGMKQQSCMAVSGEVRWAVYEASTTCLFRFTTSR